MRRPQNTAKIMAEFSKKDKLMNIVFSVDNIYSSHLAVSIVSILLNSEKDESFSFYVLDGGIEDKNKQKINELKKIKNFDISYLKIDKEEFAGFPLNEHLMLPAYFRFKIPALINEKKVLYLDCDLIVRKSLFDLYNIDLKDKYGAACLECLISTLDSTFRTRLGIENYFNSGVILYNLDKLREDNIEKQCFDFAKEHPEKIKWSDQCVLNAVFKDNVILFDMIYNFTHQIQYRHIKIKYEQKKKDVVIFHYASSRKPWLLNKPLDVISEYYYYLMQTPFKGELISDICNSISTGHLRRILNCCRGMYS